MAVGCSRLLGALALLALLGIPWLFSAFGAIDVTVAGAGLARVEGVFHVSSYNYYLVPPSAFKLVYIVSL